jgi:hypothetical protein
VIKYVWKIIGIEAQNGLITHAHYRVLADDGENKVETEGHWEFADKTVKMPFDNVRESDIAYWVEQASIIDGVSVIKSNLEKQLETLKSGKTTLPWIKNVFSPFK